MAGGKLLKGLGKSATDVAASAKKAAEIDPQTWQNMSAAERRKVRNIREILVAKKVKTLKNKLESPNYEPAVKGETPDEKLNRQARNANRKLKQAAKNDPAVKARMEWVRANPDVPLEEMPKFEKGSAMSVGGIQSRDKMKAQKAYETYVKTKKDREKIKKKKKSAKRKQIVQKVSAAKGGMVNKKSRSSNVDYRKGGMFYVGGTSAKVTPINKGKK